MSITKALIEIPCQENCGHDRMDKGKILKPLLKKLVVYIELKEIFYRYNSIRIKEKR
jgi:hypothetical protein